MSWEGGGEREIEWNSGEKKNPLSILLQDKIWGEGGGNVFLMAIGGWGCRIDANRMCIYWPANQINHLFCLLQPSTTHCYTSSFLPFSHMWADTVTSTSDNSAATLIHRLFQQPCFSIKTCSCLSLKIQFGRRNWYEWRPDAVNTFSVTSHFPLNQSKTTTTTFLPWINRLCIKPSLHHHHHIFFFFFKSFSKGWKVEIRQQQWSPSHFAPLAHYSLGWGMEEGGMGGCHPELRPPSQGAKCLVKRVAFKSFFTEERSPFHS